METSTDYPPLDCRHFGQHEGSKDQDSGLGEPDHWRFTPSMLDTNSYAFTAFANQHSDGFTPSLGVNMSGIIHNQAGDLHTPGIGFGLGTPLSLSNSESHPNSASAMDMNGFHPHLLNPQPFQNTNSFAQPQAYAPSSFMHRDSGYDTMHGAPEGLPSGNIAEIQEPPNFAGFSAGSFENVSAQSFQSLEK